MIPDDSEGQRSSDEEFSCFEREAEKVIKENWNAQSNT